MCSEADFESYAKHNPDLICLIDGRLLSQEQLTFTQWNAIMGSRAARIEYDVDLFELIEQASRNHALRKHAIRAISKTPFPRTADLWVCYTSKKWKLNYENIIKTKEELTDGK